MKKKIIVLALCTGMLAGTVAQAQKVEIIPDTQKVTFTDNIPPNTLGVCFVVKKGESIDDNSKVYALKNAKSNTEGVIEISFVMPEKKNNELSDGEYEIYINEATNPTVFTYASLETRKALLESIQKIQNVDELKTVLENDGNDIVLKAIGCKTDYYNEDVAANICEKITDFQAVTLEDFKKSYNLASVINDFGNIDKDKADELLTVIDPEFEGEKYSDITDGDLTEWLSTYFTENAYTEENYRLANIQYILNKFNTVVADKIDDLFDQYDSALGITSDDRYIEYAKLTNKATVNLEIAEILSKTPAKTADDLLDVVEEAMPSGGSAGGSAGGSGGSAGGSGGSAGGGAASSDIKEPVASVVTGTLFKDLNEAEWARPAVMGLANAGIVAGDEKGNFRPNDYISREEYVKMLVVAAGKHNIYATCKFKDVSKDAWYYTYVASANASGITHGISEDEFGIGMALTRQDMAVLSLRAKGAVTKIRDNVAFADDDQISDYAKDAVSQLYMSGAVNGIGNNKFAPLGQATRAECAQIIYNLFIK